MGTHGVVKSYSGQKCLSVSITPCLGEMQAVVTEVTIEPLPSLTRTKEEPLHTPRFPGAPPKAGLLPLVCAWIWS